MVRSRRTKIPAEEKTRLVLAVLANEMTCAEAARRCGVTAVTMTKWKHQFLEAGAGRLQEVPGGQAGRLGTPEHSAPSNTSTFSAATSATATPWTWRYTVSASSTTPSDPTKPSTTAHPDRHISNNPDPKPANFLTQDSRPPTSRGVTVQIGRAKNLRTDT